MKLRKDRMILESSRRIPLMILVLTLVAPDLAQSLAYVAR